MKSRGGREKEVGERRERDREKEKERERESFLVTSSKGQNIIG
jgi:hypothetical protein